MERREFLKLTLGVAGVVAVGAAATRAQAAPMVPPLGAPDLGAANTPQSAIATDRDIDGAAVEPVRWGWRRRGWRGRGWRRRRWRRWV